MSQCGVGTLGIHTCIAKSLGDSAPPPSRGDLGSDEEVSETGIAEKIQFLESLHDRVHGHVGVAVVEQSGREFGSGSFAIPEQPQGALLRPGEFLGTYALHQLQFVTPLTCFEVEGSYDVSRCREDGGLTEEELSPSGTSASDLDDPNRVAGTAHRLLLVVRFGIFCRRGDHSVDGQAERLPNAGFDLVARIEVPWRYSLAASRP